MAASADVATEDLIDDDNEEELNNFQVGILPEAVGEGVVDTSVSDGEVVDRTVVFQDSTQEDAFQANTRRLDVTGDTVQSRKSCSSKAENDSDFSNNGLTESEDISLLIFDDKATFNKTTDICNDSTIIVNESVTHESAIPDVADTHESAIPDVADTHESVTHESVTHEVADTHESVTHEVADTHESVTHESVTHEVADTHESATLQNDEIDKIISVTSAQNAEELNTTQTARVISDESDDETDSANITEIFHDTSPCELLINKDTRDTLLLKNQGAIVMEDISLDTVPQSDQFSQSNACQFASVSKIDEGSKPEKTDLELTDDTLVFEIESSHGSNYITVSPSKLNVFSECIIGDSVLNETSVTETQHSTTSESDDVVGTKQLTTSTTPSPQTSTSSAGTGIITSSVAHNSTVSSNSTANVPSVCVFVTEEQTSPGSRPKCQSADEISCRSASLSNSVIDIEDSDSVSAAVGAPVSAPVDALDSAPVGAAVGAPVDTPDSAPVNAPVSTILVSLSVTERDTYMDGASREVSLLPASAACIVSSETCSPKQATTKQEMASHRVKTCVPETNVNRVIKMPRFDKAKQFHIGVHKKETNVGESVRITASTAPASTAPSSTAPASTAPASTAPASTAPASTTPASTAPANTAPASTAPANTSQHEKAGPTSQAKKNKIFGEFIH